MLTITALAGCGPAGEAGLSDRELAEGLWRLSRDWPAWAAPEGWEGTQASSPEAEGSHGVYTEIRLNALAEGTLGGDVREGGILLSLALEDDGETVRQWAAMRKIPGYDGEHGDWFWARYSPEGEVQISGSATDCIRCHLNGTDYVYTAWLRP